ncbi:beta-ketoacyl-ACP synthase III [Aeromonas schubertii]|uniref:Beta-ketoacyl-ACP synthase III n=1 Tax=Aeromonas schubertii TaxID=652 RepID=A0ABS7VEF9_9GAMM|nr:beta-ketoacyl-ACP synthase III [Aeromonas schubertii]KUE80588.1 3-oxoacyl-ACP synthase [Aeromonas schubertii]MBZ6067371.1 beta-ketoacyl-ACP synthase III [Aeromonas schubertii]MBZ6070923.1 beta-ketoacyl-ACP synthase III [Aeromonas schubertii]QCG47317.1 beta-ketoacyl-ACP synthase III [Aeromonas schubertii]
MTSTTTDAIVISGSGLYTPPHAVSNEALVEAFNRWVDLYNEENASAIDAGQIPAKQYSSCDFIEKASGIKSRYLMSKEGVLDPEVMQPLIPERADDKPSLMVEMAVAAAEEALREAGREPGEIDLVIVGASNMPRPYPALAVELQHYLGAGGAAFDMNVACSSATFAIKTAADLLRAGTARLALVVNPEICSGHLNFRDRDSHFIFGDACTAVLLERAETSRTPHPWELVDARLVTRYSNNIRNNFGFLNRCSPDTRYGDDKLFVQQGRKVFKEVLPMVSELVATQLGEAGWGSESLARLWLHQANLTMNQFIARKVLGQDATTEQAPVILDRYGNTSSAGSIIAFHLYNRDLPVGARGVLCSFGAGYSVGSLLLRRR